MIYIWYMHAPDNLGGDIKATSQIERGHMHALKQRKTDLILCIYIFCWMIPPALCGTSPGGGRFCLLFHWWRCACAYIMCVFFAWKVVLEILPVGIPIPTTTTTPLGSLPVELAYVCTAVPSDKSGIQTLEGTTDSSTYNIMYTAVRLCWIEIGRKIRLIGNNARTTDTPRWL